MRLQGFLDKWIALSHEEETAEAINQIFGKEQFINSCPRDVSAHLRESVLANLKELTIGQPNAT